VGSFSDRVWGVSRDPQQGRMSPLTASARALPGLIAPAGPPRQADGRGALMAYFGYIRSKVSCRDVETFGGRGDADKGVRRSPHVVSVPCEADRSVLIHVFAEFSMRLRHGQAALDTSIGATEDRHERRASGHVRSAAWASHESGGLSARLRVLHLVFSSNQTMGLNVAVGRLVLLGHRPHPRALQASRVRGVSPGLALLTSRTCAQRVETEGRTDLDIKDELFSCPPSGAGGGRAGPCAVRRHKALAGRGHRVPGHAVRPRGGGGGMWVGRRPTAFSSRRCRGHSSVTSLGRPTGLPAIVTAEVERAGLTGAADLALAATRTGQRPAEGRTTC
jgi:hypothetical protein